MWAVALMIGIPLFLCFISPNEVEVKNRRAEAGFRRMTTGKNKSGRVARRRAFE